MTSQTISHDRIPAQIGSGGMGVVYEGVLKRLDFERPRFGLVRFNQDGKASDAR
jgi:hypothetical protein